MAGAGLAGSGLWAACGRGMGAVPDEDGGTTPADARPTDPDGNIPMPGDMPYPDYFTLRIPAEGDTSAWLVDGGYATFWVEVATYVEASYLALLDNRAAAEERCRTVLSDHTYDELSTGAGVTAAEEEILEELDTLCQEIGRHTAATIEAVTLTITYLQDEAPLDGGMPEPQYP